MDSIFNISVLALGAFFVIAMLVYKARTEWIRFERNEIYVIDGDTFDLNRNGQRIRVRPIGFDAPERGQAGGDIATRRLRELANKGLTVRFRGTDVYGRVTSDVKTCDGRLNRVMLREGFAHHTSRSGIVRFIATLGPRIAGRGIWAGSILGVGVTNPRIYRKLKDKGLV